jgi:4-carboxymuconolactone decarboxylase
VSNKEGSVHIPTAALTAGFLLFLSTIGSAQDRMPPIPRDKMTDAQKTAEAELVSGPRGALFGPFIPLLRSPEFMTRLQKTGEYLRFQNAIGQRLTEFVILLTARQWTQQYEYDVHLPLALQAGIKQEVVDAITAGRRPAGMSADEEIAYEFFAELHQNQSVADTTYARAVARFGERGVIDMTGLIGYYTTLAMILNVARTAVPDNRQPLPPLPR